MEAICGMVFPSDPRKKRGSETMAVSFKGAHFPQDIILMGVRWYVAYPLSYEPMVLVSCRLGNYISIL